MRGPSFFRFRQIKCGTGSRHSWLYSLFIFIVISVCVCVWGGAACHCCLFACCCHRTPFSSSSRPQRTSHTLFGAGARLATVEKYGHFPCLVLADLSVPDSWFLGSSIVFVFNIMDPVVSTQLQTLESSFASCWLNNFPFGLK